MDQLTCRAAQDFISQQGSPTPLVGDMSLCPVNYCQATFLKNYGNFTIKSHTQL